MSEKKESPKARDPTRLYLENAARARAAAEVAKDSAVRELYLSLAASWERLANRPDWFEKL